jgi:RNA 2',3'-cyclic 3'-phosphodiesterase
MRLFTALDLPEDLLFRLEQTIQALRPAAPSIGWSPTANLHITAKFIGQWQDERLEEMQSALRGVASPGPIKVSVRGLGFYPHARSPRVFWAGVERTPELAALAASISHALEPLGVEPEKREFSPHLTLARIKMDAPLEGLRRGLARVAAEFGGFEAKAFYLYRSSPGRGGSEYAKLGAFPLGG